RVSEGEIGQRRDSVLLGEGQLRTKTHVSHGPKDCLSRHRREAGRICGGRKAALREPLLRDRHGSNRLRQRPATPGRLLPDYLERFETGWTYGIERKHCP